MAHATVITTADRCLTPAQLSVAYFPHRSAATIKKDLSRNPSSLPPFFRIGRQTLFRESTVLSWLDQQEAAWARPASEGGNVEQSAKKTPGRRRLGGGK